MPARSSPAVPVVRPDYLAFGRPNFSGKEIAAVTRVLRSGWVGMGPEVIAFEKELADFVGAPHVVTVNSCTSALHLALLVSGVGAGDEVICPSLTWCSTANAALYVGARPVFCDVNPNTLGLTPETVLAKISRKTKAVIVVHYGGLALDVHALRRVLPARIAIIEDAAHAFGGRYPTGRPVGSSGNLVCFSFYANKNLSTAEGGALALPSRSTADRLRSLRQHGLPVDAWKRFTHACVMPPADLLELGYKMNYTDLQASIGRVQLRRQGEFDRRRLAIAKSYARALAGAALQFQAGVLATGHARHLFVVSLPPSYGARTRNKLVLDLRGRNIGASIHYPPLHRMEIYRHLHRSALPVTESLAERILTLPIGAHMSLSDADSVASACLELLNS